MSESAGFVSKLTDGFLSFGESFIPSSYVTSFRELILDNENTIALQILVILVVWLLLNLCLIRSAWSIYSSDVHSILTAQGRTQSVPRERERRDTDNGHMKRE